MKAEELWTKFCNEKNVDVTSPYEAWGFCGGEDGCDELLELVLEGKKFGTASIYEDYVAEGDEIPGDREYSVLLNSKEEAFVVIRNFEVKVEPFYRVSEYHGFSEGEHERNLEAWRRIHDNYWKDDFKRLGLSGAKDCHVVEEKFTVEYLAPGVNGKDGLLDDLFLIEPNARYADSISEFRNAMIEAGSSMDGTMSLSRIADPGEWVSFSYEKGNPLGKFKEDEITGTVLMCVRKSDDKVVGMCHVRNFDEKHPLKFCGDVGYSVHPAERRKGYATWILKKALEYLKYGKNVCVAQISALPENEASIKTITKCGGVFRDTCTDFRSGKLINRYLIDLKDF